MNCIPSDANQLGTIINYVQDGLVLHIDCLRPRRDDTIPAEATTLWEDLTGNYDLTLTTAKSFADVNSGITFTGEQKADNTAFPRRSDYYAEFIAQVVGGALVFRIYGTNGYSSVSISTIWTSIFNDKNRVNPWKVERKSFMPKACYQCYSNPDKARVNGNSINYIKGEEGVSEFRGLSVINNVNGTATVWSLRIYNRQLEPFEMQHNWLLDKKRYNL